MASSWERRDEDKEERLYNALGATLNRLIETYLPCPFWRKANNFETVVKPPGLSSACMME
jgi:hypothetical protein